MSQNFYPAMIGKILEQDQQGWLREAYQSARPFLVAAVVLIASLVQYIRVYSYWPSRGFKGDQPVLPLIWDLWNFFLNDQRTLAVARTRKYGKIYGTFFMGDKRLVVNDPEIIRLIAVKEFDKFPDHTEKKGFHELQKNQLFFRKGDQWRRARTLMSPTLNGLNIKRMFRLLDECSNDLVENFREQFIWARRNGDKKALVDAHETCGPYILDGITTCCYGTKLKRQQQKSLKQLKYKSSSGSRDTFISDLNKLTGPTLLRLVMVQLLPDFLLNLLGVSLVPRRDSEPVKDRLKKMVDLRRDEPVVGQKYEDLLQSLVDAKLDNKLALNESDLDPESHHAGLEVDQQAGGLFLEKHQAKDLAEKLGDDEIIAEAIHLLSAGYASTKSSLSTIIYHLANEPQVQERLLEEIKAIAQYTPTAMGKHLMFDYDTLTSCQYLDAVVSETLRMFAPTVMTDRCAKQDYRIEKYGVTIPKGAHVFLGIHSVHMDPDYWSEPDKFRPDRFMAGEREKIVPGSYMPFSLGPRHCLGMRFSLAETKLALAKIVMNFKFEPAPNTQYPARANRFQFLVNVSNCKVLMSMRDQDW